VLKAVWYWDSDSSDINDPLGEAGRTPLSVSLPFAWGSVNGDCMFFLISWEGSILEALTGMN
jgi:hypothetical protein